MHSDSEIDRNQKPEELLKLGGLKLGGGQKIFIFRGGGGLAI